MDRDLSRIVVEFVGEHILDIGFAFVWLIAGILGQRMADRIVRPRVGN